MNYGSAEDILDGLGVQKLGGAVAPGAEEPQERRSWQRVDLTEVIEGRYRPPVPTVGARADGAGLFYPGRIHTLTSESEGGKTWLALLAAMVELERGNAVVFVDFEDEEGGVVGRLLELGADPAAVRDRFAYIRPEDSIAAVPNRDDLAEVLGDLRPTLVFLDGVTEAMTLHGLELKDNTDIARFGKLLPRWIATQGPAVAAADHVTKDRDGRGRYALGGVHKLNGVNGAAYVLENRQPFGIGMTGRSTLFIAKDRPGQLRRNALPAREGLWWYADLIVESVTDAGAFYATASLSVPARRDDEFRPTVLMGKVSKAMTKAGDPLSQREIEARVRHKATDVRAAVAVLIDEGYVKVDPGPRGAKLHTLVKAYDPSADEGKVTASRLRPSASRTQTDVSASASPPIGDALTDWTDDAHPSASRDCGHDGCPPEGPCEWGQRDSGDSPTDGGEPPPHEEETASTLFARVETLHESWHDLMDIGMELRQPLAAGQDTLFSKAIRVKEVHRKTWAEYIEATKADIRSWERTEGRGKRGVGQKVTTTFNNPHGWRSAPGDAGHPDFEICNSIFDTGPPLKCEGEPTVWRIQTPYHHVVSSAYWCDGHLPTEDRP